MKQLILPDDYNGEKVFTLSEEDSHYLLRVQRKTIGYSLNLLNNKGQKYHGTIVDIVENLCQMRLEELQSARENSNNIIVLQAIPKGKKIDLMIRQSVEIGVKNFYPIIADHSVPSFKTEEDKIKKHKRWKKIIKEASQQSGTEILTKLEPLQSFSEVLDNLPKPYTGLFFHQVPLENSSMHQLLSSANENIILVIGPEGGLSLKEVDLLKKYNFTPCLLGDNILRAETATTFALGAVKMILLERNNWKIN